jgi:predicted DCC family thiol-disulfide oxidoreductase YuxK
VGAHASGSVGGVTGQVGSVLVFDGDCGSCTTAAEWARRGWGDDAVRAVSYQALGDDGLSALGLSVSDARGAAWWAGPDGNLWRGHRAVAMALRHGRGWRPPAGLLLLTPPVTWIGAGVYGVVARWRHRLPGGTPACRATGT